MPRKNSNGRGRGHQELNGDKVLLTLSTRRLHPTCIRPHDKERTFRDRSAANQAREKIEPFIKSWYTRIRRCNLHEVYLFVDAQ